MLLNVKNPILKKGKHYLTSDYKTRNKKRTNHCGIDLVGKNGVDDVIAIETGKVSYIGYDKYGGYWVSIKTNKIEHRYFHLKKGSIKVRKKEMIKKGEVIATMGKTGNATNNCLHFAIYKKGYKDPLPYLINSNPFKINKEKDSNFITFVKGVQKTCGAPIDGIPGPITLSKTITVSTKENYNHPVVKVLQTYLKSLGYDLGKHGTDGIFGPQMKEIIIKYQKDNDLPIKDGIITAKKYTWQSLLQL